MSHKQLSTWQKATALVPLALLSGAWTVSLAITSSSANANTSDDTTTLPDGTTVPDQALEAPASMSRPGSIALGVDGATESLIAEASANGIPAAALAAYQRAEQVINSADASCNLSWQLIAAIGRVESDHGRYGGNVLGDDGRSRPGIFGIPLDGSNGTAQIRDSDAGQYDDDPVWDRAVGPMQFIPQTWTIVGVDGDGDGVRDPQDIDDAALASAVYLCSGDEDLSTYGGQKAAVYRYNHSQEYVDLVIAIMNAYLGGDYSAVPNGIATSVVFTPWPAAAGGFPATSGAQRPETRETAGTRDSRRGSGSGDGSSGDGDGSSSDDGGVPEAPSVPGEEPTGSDPVGSVTGTVDETTKEVEDTTKKVTKPVEDATDTVKDTVDDVVDVVEGTTGGLLN
jgi:membrane-bound lytic murein transglycosylase B